MTKPGAGGNYAAFPIDLYTMIRRTLVGLGVVAVSILVTAAPVWAHVTTDPDSAAQGGEITLRFRVPNEVTAANVVKVDIAIPLDHPLLGVDVEPLTGWTSVVTEAKLNPPVQTDDGPVTQAVSEIVWTAAAGGGTAPGQFQEFPILIQQLPSTTQVVFKAVQTYSDATVVRWIDPVVAGQPAPDHPTPILTLTPSNRTGATTPASPGASSSATTPAAPTVDVSRLAKKSSVSSAAALGVVGIVVGALGLVVAVAALRRRGGTAV